jgi:NAD(P)-dependent dehydrogenase (short-subunit alcohol dehydrogenase family)
MFDLGGRVALVTGAGQGVGAAVARLLADQGAAVAVNDLRSERAATTASSIITAGGRAAAVAFDVADGVAVGDGVAAIVTALGPIDILVNSAGSRPAPTAGMAFRDMDPADWHEAFGLGLFGVLECTRAVIDGMCEQRWGRVITVCRAIDDRAAPTTGISLADTANASTIGFMRKLSSEVGQWGVTVNTLTGGESRLSPLPACPTGRPARAASSPYVADPDISSAPSGCWSDIGAACVYLASDEAGWLTGQTFGSNGGRFAA